MTVLDDVLEGTDHIVGGRLTVAILLPVTSPTRKRELPTFNSDVARWLAGIATLPLGPTPLLQHLVKTRRNTHDKTYLDAGLQSGVCRYTMAHWFWWAELSHAYEVFKDAGHDVTIASPNGGEILADAYSDPDDDSGYSVEDTISLAFKQDRSKMALLKNTPALADLNTADFDAVFVVGGQGPMVTMIDDPNTHKAVADFYEAGKVTAAVCHGTCVC